MSERSHAGHDLRAAKRTSQALGHLLPHRHVRPVPLRFDNHRSRQVEWTQLIRNKRQEGESGQRSDAPDKTLAFLFLGGLFVVQGTLFLLAVVLAANYVRRLAAGSGARRLLNGGGGLLFALLAARLALSDRP